MNCKLFICLSSLLLLAACKSVPDKKLPQWKQEMNIFTQYVHLTHQGSLVSVGDRVAAGQSIGLSGNTGFTSAEHLHFNVLKANEKGIQSLEVVFREGYEGRQLKAGMRVKK